MFSQGSGHFVTSRTDRVVNFRRGIVDQGIFLPFFSIGNERLLKTLAIFYHLMGTALKPVPIQPEVMLPGK